jgi:hypothetical protein
MIRNIEETLPHTLHFERRRGHSSGGITVPVSFVFSFQTKVCSNTPPDRGSRISLEFTAAIFLDPNRPSSWRREWFGMPKHAGDVCSERLRNRLWRHWERTVHRTAANL